MVQRHAAQNVLNMFRNTSSVCEMTDELQRNTLKKEGNLRVN